ncbi:MAG: hypothetical protein LBS77_06130 [Desulfovibrio sp.]|nr:hypothetical protein [Desulfovibrio sp.]
MNNISVKGGILTADSVNVCVWGGGFPLTANKSTLLNSAGNWMPGLDRAN